MREWIRERLASQIGATSVEYGLVVALIGLVVFAAVMLLGGATNDNIDCAGRAWATLSEC